jgi:hypothetical protein
MKIILNIASLVQRKLFRARTPVIAPAQRRARAAKGPRLSDTEKFLATVSLASIIAVTLCVWSSSRADAREWNVNRQNIGAAGTLPALEKTPVTNPYHGAVTNKNHAAVLSNLTPVPETSAASMISVGFLLIAHRRIHGMKNEF